MDLNIIRNGEKITVPVEDYNAELASTIIKKQENPSPILILSYVFVVVLLIYYIYVTMIKTCYNGKWYTSNNIYSIKHNKFNDVIDVFDQNGNLSQGYVCGRAIFIKIGGELNMGVMQNRNIAWTNGEVWKKIIKVE